MPSPSLLLSSFQQGQTLLTGDTAGAVEKCCPSHPGDGVKQPAGGKPGELELRELRGASRCGQGGLVKPAPRLSHSRLPLCPQCTPQKLPAGTLCPQTGVLGPRGSPVPCRVASPPASVLELIPLHSPPSRGLTSLVGWPLVQMLRSKQQFPKCSPWSTIVGELPIGGE